MKKTIMLPVSVDESLFPILEKFIAGNGVFSNINNGLITEPLFEHIFSEYFESKTSFVNKYGYDYETEDGNKIEHKTLSINQSAAILNNFGEIKSEADYLSIFHPVLNRLFIMSMSDAKTYFEISEDISNNKQYVRFCGDLDINPRKRMGSTASYNTCTLLDLIGTEIEL